MKNLKVYESFGNFQSTPRITPELIGEKGLNRIITSNPFLDTWFDAYFKNVSGDPYYDYASDEDFWYHTDEIIGYEEEDEGDEDEYESLRDEYWAKVLNYIIENRPNPLSKRDALEDAIQKSLNR